MCEDRQSAAEATMFSMLSMFLFPYFTFVETQPIFNVDVNPHVAFIIPWGLTYWDPMLPQEATDQQRHSTSWMKDPHSAPFLCNRWAWQILSLDASSLLLSHIVSGFRCSALFVLKFCLYFKTLPLVHHSDRIKTRRPDRCHVDFIATATSKEHRPQLLGGWNQGCVLLCLRGFPTPKLSFVRDLKADRASFSILLWLLITY